MFHKAPLSHSSYYRVGRPHARIRRRERRRQGPRVRDHIQWTGAFVASFFCFPADRTVLISVHFNCFRQQNLILLLRVWRDVLLEINWRIFGTLES